MMNKITVLSQPDIFEKSRKTFKNPLTNRYQMWYNVSTIEREIHGTKISIP